MTGKFKYNNQIITASSKKEAIHKIVAGRTAKFALSQEQVKRLKALGFKNFPKGSFLYPSISKNEKENRTAFVTYEPSRGPVKFIYSEKDSNGIFMYESARYTLDRLLDDMESRHKIPKLGSADSIIAKCTDSLYDIAKEVGAKDTKQQIKNRGFFILNKKYRIEPHGGFGGNLFAVKDISKKFANYLCLGNKDKVIEWLNAHK